MCCSTGSSHSIRSYDLFALTAPKPPARHTHDVVIDLTGRHPVVALRQRWADRGAASPSDDDAAAAAAAGASQR